MTINILAIGDVVGECGLDFMEQKLRAVKKLNNISFTIANGENAANLGITPNQAELLFNAGTDVLTLGNHTWSKREIQPFLDDCKYILRPANFAPQVSGRGWGVFETSFGNMCVINLIGRKGMDDNAESPFFEVDKILKQLASEDVKIVLVDFHAEMTSEKLAMAYHLDGRVSAMWGTHTHVQTSDCRVFSGGMGYITDLGMTGAYESVIGIKAEQSVSRFLGNPPSRYDAADGPAKLEGAIFEIDAETGKCVSVEAIRIM